jgi:hypothetical protein
MHDGACSARRSFGAGLTLIGCATAGDYSWKLSWPWAVAFAGGNRYVIQFYSLTHAPKHQSATAHVPTSSKFRGKNQPLAKNGKQRLDILRRRDTAQEDDLAIIGQMRGDKSSISLKGNTVTRLRRFDRRGRDQAELLSVYRRFRRQETAAGGDNQCSGHSIWCASERARVSELASKIQSADETEGVPQWKSTILQALS